MAEKRLLITPPRSCRSPPTSLFIRSGLRPVDGAADFEIECGVAGFVREREEIFADRREELAAHFVVERELRIEMEFAFRN